MMIWAKTPTSEPALVEVDAPANACDDAAAAVCDNAATDSPNADAADDDATADPPTASYGIVACNPSNVVEVALSEISDGMLVRRVEFGFTIIKTLDCAHSEHLKIRVRTYRPDLILATSSE